MILQVQRSPGFAVAGGQEELRCEWPPPSAISQAPVVVPEKRV